MISFFICNRRTAIKSSMSEVFVVSPYVQFENVLQFSIPVALVTCWVVSSLTENIREDNKVWLSKTFILLTT
jgi:Na+(H+)/acetate symporter ActP